MKQEIKEIPFNGGTLLGIRDEQGQIWLAIKKACLDIGLTENQAKAETKKIQNNLLFTSNWVKFDIVQSEGNRKINREVLMLHEKFVPMWLAQIRLTPIMKKENPLAVNKLLKYQLEVSDVLHNAFMGTEEKKQEFFSSMGLQGEIADLKQEVTQMKGSIDQLIDSSTINTTQQQVIHRLAKDKINNLLGGAHSKTYKSFSKSYFSNLWNNFKERFHCSSYRDLNPKDFGKAKNFIENWEYKIN